MEWRGGHTGIRGPDGQEYLNNERKVSPPYTHKYQPKGTTKKYSLKMKKMTENITNIKKYGGRV